MSLRVGAVHPSVLITIAALVLVMSVASTSLLLRTVLFPPGWRGDHPNIPLRCDGQPLGRLSLPPPAGPYLADHRCVPTCPIGYSPVAWSLGNPPVCMTHDNVPVSIYDLAGLQVSSDNGATVYLVISNVPMQKMRITSANYNLGVHLPVSQSILDQLPRVVSFPSVRTEIATVGDFVAGSLIVRTISPTSVQGNFSIPYPVCCYWQSKTIHAGDDIGITCQGESEILQSIDYRDQIATFTATQGATPYGGCPICLSGNTVISTPDGDVNVKNIKVGEPVWTVDSSGNRIAGTVLETGRTLVPSSDMIVHLVLWDGRQLYASSGHPTFDGRTIGQLKPGDTMDKSVVKTTDLVPYTQSYTYDLLPSGSTGFYWADDILVGSTLHR